MIAIDFLSNKKLRSLDRDQRSFFNYCILAEDPARTKAFTSTYIGCVGVFSHVRQAPLEFSSHA
jgi:hypothetical protein